MIEEINAEEVLFIASEPVPEQFVQRQPLPKIPRQSEQVIIPGGVVKEPMSKAKHRIARKKSIRVREILFCVSMFAAGVDVRIGEETFGDSSGTQRHVNCRWCNLTLIRDLGKGCSEHSAVVG